MVKKKYKCSTEDTIPAKILLPDISFLYGLASLTCFMSSLPQLQFLDGVHLTLSHFFLLSHVIPLFYWQINTYLLYAYGTTANGMKR